MDELLVHRDLELNFAKQVDAEFVPAVHTCLAFLAAEALAVHYREPEYLNLGERFLNSFQFGGLDDRDDELHGGWSSAG